MTHDQTPADDTVDTWLHDVATALGLPDASALDTPGLLALVRQVAHGVARPAGPLTAFMVGYAAGLHGGAPDAVHDALSKVTALVETRTDGAA